MLSSWYTELQDICRMNGATHALCLAMLHSSRFENIIYVFWDTSISIKTKSILLMQTSSLLHDHYKTIPLDFSLLVHLQELFWHCRWCRGHIKHRMTCQRFSGELEVYIIQPGNSHMGIEHDPFCEKKQMVDFF